MNTYEYLTLVLLHILGAGVWIGSLVSAVFGSIPHARKAAIWPRLKHVGKIVLGRIGLAALILQILTGARLGFRFGWGLIFKFQGPASHLIFTKIALLLIVLVLGGYAYHKMLPSLTKERLGMFNALTWVLLVLSLLIAFAGAGLQTGSLL